MAERRMFAKTIIDSDAFIDMPVTSRLLYYDLVMRADDDGFVNSPKKIMRMIGASDDDIRILIARKFIIPFESGIVVIKHWRIHNYIRKDTYSETPYLSEKSMLEMDENKAYELKRDESVDGSSTQVRIGKDSIDKGSKENILSNAKASPEDVFFESVWKLYPKKKGKGQVSFAKKQKLMHIGYAEIARCVQRYVSEFEESGKSNQFMMYGSTFFNSGYVDYLDVNYGTEESVQEKAEEPVLDLWGDD